MRMGGITFEPWDLWGDYAKHSPSMVRRELWKARFRDKELGWPRRDLALKLAKLAFVLQKQVPDSKRLSEKEMRSLLNF